MRFSGRVGAITFLSRRGCQPAHGDTIPSFFFAAVSLALPNAISRVFVFSIRKSQRRPSPHVNTGHATTRLDGGYGTESGGVSQRPLNQFTKNINHHPNSIVPENAARDTPPDWFGTAAALDALRHQETQQQLTSFQTIHRAQPVPDQPCQPFCPGQTQHHADDTLDGGAGLQRDAVSVEDVDAEVYAMLVAAEPGHTDPNPMETLPLHGGVEGDMSLGDDDLDIYLRVPDPEGVVSSAQAFDQAVALTGHQWLGGVASPGVPTAQHRTSMVDAL